MQHLISVDDLSKPQVEQIFQLTNKYLVADSCTDCMKGKKVLQLFFEHSTRTALSFKIAATAVGGMCFDFNINNSAINKGESLIDTLNTVAAMHPDFLIIRHNRSGICHLIKNHIDEKKITIINAGDGTNEHPTQALIDLFTLTTLYKIPDVKVAICGDICHSRVAHSNIKLLEKFGIKVVLVGPPNLLPNLFNKYEVYHRVSDALNKVDVVILLRLQSERILSSFIPSKNEYCSLYGLDKTKLAKATKNLTIMHPGPINRGWEICSDILSETVINKQVTYGLALRKALFEYYCANKLN